MLRCASGMPTQVQVAPRHICVEGGGAARAVEALFGGLEASSDDFEPNVHNQQLHVTPRAMLWCASEMPTQVQVTPRHIRVDKRAAARAGQALGGGHWADSDVVEPSSDNQQLHATHGI